MLEDYLAQDKWRQWETMIGHLPIQPEQSVLDLGCGPGLVSARLAARCQRLIGVDRESTFLDFARQHCPSKCQFIEAGLADFDARSVGAVAPVDGLWSSFVAAYFPTFAPVLARWVSCLAPGGWLAIIEIDDLLTGHRPLPEDTNNAFQEFTDYARSHDHYDFRMGGRLAEICRAVGLSVVSQHSFKDRELAFDGAAPPEIQAAWSARFARMHGMKAYFGSDRFDQLTESFLSTLSSSDHVSATSVQMVIAKRLLP